MSMPEITFYFNVQGREAALCQLLGKALQHKKTINILTDSESASTSLDRLLWEIPSTGFLPHCAADYALATETAICLDHRADLFTARDILFNWGTQIATQRDCQRIIEIVDRSEEQRTQARQRFRAYQAQGYTVHSIDMSKRS
jgi:DNA polymerase-3 subunit chi